MFSFSLSSSSAWLPVHTRECYVRIRHRTSRINRTFLWIALGATFLVSLHSLLRYLRPEYANITSVTRYRVHFQWPLEDTTNSTASPLSSSPSSSEETSEPEPELENNGTRRANAAIVMLVRNSELESALSSVTQLEARFNHRFGYPWVFLNEVPFTDEFKEKMSGAIAGPVSFGRIPKEDWYQPDWIDEDRATASRDQMVANNVVYGGSLSYRNMCRFNSGFFYRHPLMHRYKWYWRVEPGVSFHCDTDYDPFVFMEDNDKVYGFTISLFEWPLTIKTLWSAVKEFVAANPGHIAPNNSMAFLSDDNGHSYNLCHFWSNFEIANMELWRSDAYSKFFEHLESKGGFYYERWGDAPVHSIGAALFARKDQIHFFDDIGYRHPPFMHCPRDPHVRQQRNCTCKSFESFDNNMYSCLRKWEEVTRS